VNENWLIAIRLRQLGDVLCTLGALRALKDAEPERRIAYVVDAHYHALLSGFDAVDRLLPSPPRAREGGGVAAYARYVSALRRLRPSAVVDFHGSARSALLARLSGAPLRIGYDLRLRRRAYTVVAPRAFMRDGRAVSATAAASALSLARHAGASDGVETLAAIEVEDAAVARGREALVGAGVPRDVVARRALVGINPGRAYPAKAWARTKWVALARELVARGWSVLVMWGPGEADLARAIAAEAGTSVHAAPPADIAAMPGLLRSLSLLVTIDSGLKHLAVCARVPTVTLFGSTDPREWHMGTPADAFLWKGYSCSPCRRTVCPFGAPCMDFDVEAVLGLAAPFVREARA